MEPLKGKLTLMLTVLLCSQVRCADRGDTLHETEITVLVICTKRRPCVKTTIFYYVRPNLA